MRGASLDMCLGQVRTQSTASSPYHLSEEAFRQQILPYQTFLSVLNLSAQSEYFWAHFQIDTWLLSTTLDRHLAANLKLLELKYMYSPYLIIAVGVF